MEKATLVTRKHGRRIKHAYYEHIQDVCIVSVPVKQDKLVYIGIPGANQDFIEVYAEPWDGKNDTLVGAINRGRATVHGRNPSKWAYSFSEKMLTAIRDKGIQVHPQYMDALKDDYAAFNGGKIWK